MKGSNLVGFPSNVYFRLMTSLAHNVKRGRDSKIVGNNTIARIDGDGVIIRYHSTDILRATSDGLVHVLSGHASFTSRVRHAEWMARGWRTFQQQNEAYLTGYGDHGRFELPFRRGLVTGWNVTASHIRLNLRMKLGDAEAADELAAWFNAQGWSAMSEACLENRGKRWGLNYKRVKERLDELEAYVQAEDGRWFADASSGALVRAVIPEDVDLWGVPPPGTPLSDTPIQVLGRELLIVDGFAYSARSA